MKRLTPAEVASSYDRASVDYDARHPWRLQRKYSRIEKSMRTLLEGDRVLDLGCGTGRLFRGMAGRRAVGIDISLGMLKVAGSEVPRVCADAHHLPFSDGSFDAVIATQGVVRYLDLGILMPEIKRVLRFGGRFAAHQFGGVLSLRTLRRATGALDIASPQELTRPAEAAGLRTVSVELWRPIRVPPYAIEIPNWLPGRLWTHCVAEFEKPERQR